MSSEGVVTLAMTQLLGGGTFRSVNIAVWLHLGTMFAAPVYFREVFAGILRGLSG